MRLVDVAGETAMAESDGVVRTVDVSLIDRPQPGDYVIVHAGFAIERIDPIEAETRLAWFEQLARDSARASADTAPPSGEAVG